MNILVSSRTKGMIGILVLAMLCHTQTSSGHTGDWQILRDKFQLTDYYDHRAVQAELGKFSQNYFNRLQKRLKKYQAFINHKVSEQGLPAELALLPLVESALDAEAISPASAVGFWQFMPDTAKAYGLEISDHFDARKDLALSTEAALKLLQQLYKETDDWLLAIAAYNAGIVRINREMAKQDRNYGDFWRLSLPKETRQFVARLLALSQIVMAPEQHGLSLPALKTRPTRFSAIELFQDSCCLGNRNEISTVSKINPLDIQRQLLKPPNWNTRPDKMVPINRPMAFAM